MELKFEILFYISYNYFGDYMLSIKKKVKNEIIIEKSRFITYFIRVNNEDEIKKNINDLKLEYKDATHYCFAYILDNSKRFSDDGEPGGTAGMPILNVLEHENLAFVLCIVIRYFGGIKLGAGGLVRAYTKSVTECLSKCSLVNLVAGKQIKMDFDYDKIKQIDYLLQNCFINYKEYDEFVSYEVSITNEEYNLKINELNKLCKKVIIVEEKKINIEFKIGKKEP